MNHTKKKKNGVPDKASGTPLRSVCGILCGQQKYEKEYRTKKLLKAKENTQNLKILGVILELLGRFELPTSSLPNGFMPKSSFFYRKFVFYLFRINVTIVLYLLSFVLSLSKISSQLVVTPIRKKRDGASHLFLALS